ncbi:MAG: hypothetical protein NVSMB49_22220 [Ktedonobacteraceae bacterium]
MDNIHYNDKDAYLHGDDIQRLAQWVQDILRIPPGSLGTDIAPASSSPHTNTNTQKKPITSECDIQLELLLQNSSYHKRFYQQFPDFAMALLTNDEHAATHYASLLYHLAGCNICHQSYLEIYDAMRAALFPHEPRPILGQGTRTLEATPQRMLAHLCQAWITQAEAILLQARHDVADGDVAARTLLQAAIQMSSRIKQDNVRQQARHDLVRVATLFDVSEGPKTEDALASHAYTPVLVGYRGVTRRGDIVDIHAQPKEGVQDQLAIVLQSRSLEGIVVQHGQTLELHLQDLDESLRGQFITTSIVLGSLIEPIRWLGGNPRAIRSAVPVDNAGSVVMPLGETELRLSVPEERNLLEATFLLLEVRGVA